MQSSKSISIITLFSILSLSTITAYANDTEKNKVETIEKSALSYKQDKNSLKFCKNFPLCDVDKTTKDSEWPELSVVSQK